MNWILDADIAGFFDTVGHEWLVKFVEHRIGDQRVIRLIRKWLKAGAMEDGGDAARRGDAARGGHLAAAGQYLPALYLRPLGEQWRERHAQGNVMIVRYADDIVVGFEHKPMPSGSGGPARTIGAVWAVGASGENSPDRVRPLCGRGAGAGGLGKPETFNFLGFTHISGRARSGRFMLWRRTRRDRIRAKLREIKEELRRGWHQSDPRARAMATPRGTGIL